MGPAGFSDKNRISFSYPEIFDKFLFPKIASNAVLTGIGGDANIAVVWVGMGSEAVDLIKVFGVVLINLPVNVAGGQKFLAFGGSGEIETGAKEKEMGIERFKPGGGVKA